MLPDIFPPEVLAEHLGVTTRTVYRMMSEPDGLPYVDIRGGRQIRRETWQRYLEQRERQSIPRRTGRAA